MRDKVFVYGTLRTGEANHHLLKGCRFVGEWTSLPAYTLHDLGEYPGAMAGGHTRLRGEVYEIGAQALDELDRLEECPVHYRRERIATAFGPAWIYLLNHAPATMAPIPGGDWARRHED